MLLGLARSWPTRLIGLVLAFGAGALVSAVSFELFEEGVAVGGAAAVGIGLQNKHLLLFLCASLVAGVLLARRWDVFRSPWAWAGAVLALVIWSPNLAWQAATMCKA